MSTIFSVLKQHGCVQSCGRRSGREWPCLHWLHWGSESAHGKIRLHQGVVCISIGWQHVVFDYKFWLLIKSGERQHKCCVSALDTGRTNCIQNLTVVASRLFILTHMTYLIRQCCVFFRKSLFLMWPWRRTFKRLTFVRSRWRSKSSSKWKLPSSPKREASF